MADLSLGALSDTGALTIGDGYRTKRSEHGRPGYRILRVADVADGRVTLAGDDYVHVDQRRVIGTKLSQPGDVLLTTKGTVGRVAVYPQYAEQVVYSPQLCYFRVNDLNVLHPRYLAYWFKSDSCKQQASRRANNTDMAPYINLRDIRSLQISLPDIEQQRAIAEVLGALDDKIAINDRQTQLALDLADAFFLAGLHRTSTTPMTIGELADRGDIAFGDGYRTKRAEHSQPGLRILRAGDIKNGRITPDGSDFVSNDYNRQIGPKASRPGDILLTTKGSVGRVALVSLDLERVVYSPQLCYFRVINESALDACYLAAWFRSLDLQRQASSRMFKSDMAPYINLQDIRSLTLPVPARDEQRRQGETQRTLLDSFQAACSENSRLARTRDELLPLLMSGKLRVRDAEKVVEGVV